MIDHGEGGEGWREREGVGVLLYSTSPPDERASVVWWCVCVCQSQVFGLSTSREGSLDWGGLFAACVFAAAAAAATDEQSRQTDRAKSGRVVLGSVWLWFGLVCLDGGVSGAVGAARKTTRQEGLEGMDGQTDRRTDGQMEGRGRVRTYTFYIFNLTDRLDSSSLASLRWENS